VVTAEAPVGPVADRLAGLDTALSARGVPLIRVRRAYDQMLWPEATKGFFPFKEKIPALLRRLDLG
jgi:deoxyribodipyrimidine photo-lyase